MKPSKEKICHKCGEPASQHGEFGFRDHAPRDANGDEIDSKPFRADRTTDYMNGLHTGLKEGGSGERCSDP